MCSNNLYLFYLYKVILSEIPYLPLYRSNPTGFMGANDLSSTLFLLAINHSLSLKGLFSVKCQVRTDPKETFVMVTFVISLELLFI